MRRPRLVRRGPLPVPSASMPTETLRTVCNRDCPDACGLIATVEDGRLTRLGGDPDHPVTKGFLCSRTSQFPARQNSPDRLTTPLLRDGSGFRPVSWEEALSFAAETAARDPRRVGARRDPPLPLRGLPRPRQERRRLLLRAPRPGHRQAGRHLLRGRRRRAGGRLRRRGVARLLRPPALEGDPPLGKEPVRLERPPPSPPEGGEGPRGPPRPDRPGAAQDGGSRRRVPCAAPGRGSRPRPRRGGPPLRDRSRRPRRRGLLRGLRGLPFPRPLEGVRAWAQEADVAPEALELLAAALSDRPCNIQVGWGMGRRTNGSAIVRALDALGALTGNLGIPGGGVSFYFKRRGAFDTSFLAKSPAAHPLGAAPRAGDPRGGRAPRPSRLGDRGQPRRDAPRLGDRRASLRDTGARRRRRLLHDGHRPPRAPRPPDDDPRRGRRPRGGLREPLARGLGPGRRRSGRREERPRDRPAPRGGDRPPDRRGGRRHRPEGRREREGVEAEAPPPDRADGCDGRAPRAGVGEEPARRERPLRGRAIPDAEREDAPPHGRRPLPPRRSRASRSGSSRIPPSAPRARSGPGPRRRSSRRPATPTPRPGSPTAPTSSSRARSGRSGGA
jgi:hypothetical protein